MGVVYRAHHALMRRETAVKLLMPNRADAAAIERFEREVCLTCQLTHPNTIWHQQLYCRLASHQRMTGAIDDAHPALAYFFLKLVLPELLDPQLGFIESALPHQVQVRKQEHQQGADQEQKKMHDEQNLEHAEWSERFGRVYLGGHPEAMFGKPSPGTDDGHASIVSGRHDAEPIGTADCIGSDEGQRAS